MAEDTIEGRNTVLEALRSGGRPLHKIYMLAGKKSGPLREIQRLAQKKGIDLEEVGRGRLNQLAITRNHQGVIALAAAKEYVELATILNLARERREDPFLLILDGIEDPHNLGALLRSAEGAGVHGVVIPKRRAAQLTAAVGRASAGAMEYMAVAQVTNLTRAIKELQEQGIWVAGAHPQGEKLYTDADLTGPIAIVIGAEGRGIRRLIKENCDFLLSLPMKGRISSLNASVAGSLFMYEVVRQRALREG
ncbi:MAG: 23S rRNA (guanosine(2251)-2'-O)-methyltransferase RlmB [Firmicutes bacterium]|nr:23S rRNA (guanosine(2251)-2'-O)-methyltransferase RlmB [Bacillota bacterium]